MEMELDFIVNRLMGIYNSPKTLEEKCNLLEEEFELTKSQANICKPIFEFKELPIIRYIHITTLVDGMSYNEYTHIYDFNVIDEQELKKISHLIYALIAFKLSSSASFSSPDIFTNMPINNITDAIRNTLALPQIKEKNEKHVDIKYSNYQLADFEYKTLYSTETNVGTGVIATDITSLLLI